MSVIILRHDKISAPRVAQTTHFEPAGAYWPMERVCCVSMPFYHFSPKLTGMSWLSHDLRCILWINYAKVKATCWKIWKFDATANQENATTITCVVVRSASWTFETYTNNQRCSNASLTLPLRLSKVTGQVYITFDLLALKWTLIDTD